MPHLVHINREYPLNRTLDGFQRRSERSGEEKKSCSCRDSYHEPSGPWPSIPNEISRLLSAKVKLKNIEL